MSFLMVLCLVVGVLPVKAGAVTADSFTDVSKDSWYYDYVDYVAKKGYFAGTTKTTFSPNKSMTRAMFVVVLARHDGVTVDNSKSSFSDVAAGAWCAGAVNWAAENGIVLGYPDGTFKPNESITRAQMCAIMDNYVNYYTAKHKVTAEKKGTSTVLADQNEIPAYAKTAVKNCQTYGLITGYGDGTFRPQTTSTRAQVAAVIYRLSFLTESAQPSSGGGGGGGGGGRDHTYLVRVQFSTPVQDYGLDLIAPYTVTTAANGTTTGNKNVKALARELVSGQNEGAVRAAISDLRTNAMNRHATVTVGGETVTVNVVNGVISATTTGPVVVDLQSYLEDAITLHGTKENMAIQKLAQTLGVSDRLTDSNVSAAVRAIYELSRPDNFVDIKGSTDLELKSVDAYYETLKRYVNAMCDLWEIVGEDSVFYATQLGNAQASANGYSFLGIDYPVSGVLANLMGTTGNITNTATGIILDVDAVVTEGSDGTYPEIATLLRSNLQNQGYSNIAAQIPGSVPSRLSQFLGTYNLTVTIS